MTSSDQLADVYADQGPFLLVRMSRRCASREGVDRVVADTFRSLADRPCPADDVAPELFVRACERCAQSPVCARSRAVPEPVPVPLRVRVG